MIKSIVAAASVWSALVSAAPQGWNVCDSSSFACTNDAQCSGVWPTNHPNHWRFCDQSVSPAVCAPMECGYYTNGVTKGCPAGNFVCERFRCKELTGLGEECTLDSESDHCFGSFTSCFRNLTSPPSEALLQKGEDVPPALCYPLTDWRNKPCNVLDACPSPLTCVSHPDGAKRCVDKVYLNPGDECIGSGRDACLGADNRGACRAPPRAALLVQKEAIPIGHGNCQAEYSTSPQCTSFCYSNAECESDRCISGKCVDRALLLGEACIEGAQCISGNCIDLKCVAHAPTQPPEEQPPQAGAEEVGENPPAQEQEQPSTSSTRVGDCSALTCQAGYYCSAADFEGDVDFFCKPNCQGIGSMVWDSEIGSYVCQNLAVIGNGGTCSNGHHNTCVSGHCYTPAAGTPSCVTFAVGEAPKDTSCVADAACASGLCSTGTRTCVESASLLQLDASCSATQGDQCGLDLFCDGGELDVCVSMAAMSRCSSGYDNYATTCGTATREPGVCLCSAAADSRYECNDKRGPASDLVRRGNPPFSWASADYDAFSEFSGGFWDWFAAAACPSVDPAEKRAMFTHRGSKCAEQVFTRLTGAGVSLPTSGPIPLGLSPYWLRRIVADLDAECRSHLADSVCCAACGIASGTVDLPAATIANTQQGRVWLSRHMQAFATPYVKIDCPNRTIEPDWSACEASTPGFADLTTKAWAESISACSGGAHAEVSEEPSEQAAASEMASWTAIAAAAGAAVAQGI